ncbi:MAG: hypothetical protein V5A52_06670 [Halovenus sp.]|uniref:hypothetical protein n=1 Tax=Halovenus amylolytica TaxID=2500550 RepID=UPI000FE31109
MGTERAPYDEGTNCSSSDSFDDHGIERGDQLVSRTYNRLAAGELAFEPTETFFDRLEEAFIWAFLGSVDQNGIPEHVTLAIEDAKAVTLEQFNDQPDADLRNAVVPAFYQQVAGFHCAYRETE